MRQVRIQVRRRYAASLPLTFSFSLSRLGSAEVDVTHKKLCGKVLCVRVLDIMPGGSSHGGAGIGDSSFLGDPTWGLAAVAWYGLGPRCARLRSSLRTQPKPRRRRNSR